MLMQKTIERTLRGLLVNNSRIPADKMEKIIDEFVEELVRMELIDTDDPKKDKKKGHLR